MSLSELGVGFPRAHIDVAKDRLDLDTCPHADPWHSTARGAYPSYIHPSCLRVTPSFQIFVMWLILVLSNSIT